MSLFLSFSSCSYFHSWHIHCRKSKPCARCRRRLFWGNHRSLRGSWLGLAASLFQFDEVTDLAKICKIPIQTVPVLIFVCFFSHWKGKYDFDLVWCDECSSVRVDKEIRKVEIGEGKRMESFTRGEIDIRDSRCGQEMLRRPAIGIKNYLRQIFLES